VTQNVDGLHDHAGSREHLKLHGDIWTVRCTGCGRERQDRRAPLPELPPLCECGAMLRPGVVWFGEYLPAVSGRRRNMPLPMRMCFSPSEPRRWSIPQPGLIDVARISGAKTVEINPDATPYSGVVDYPIRGSAAEVLPLLAT
jgi:NAD-dependent deacetylase